MQKYIKNQGDRFEANTSPLGGIPMEIVSSHVAPNLNHKDILSLRMTCKSFFYNDPLDKIMKSKPWNYKIFQTRDGTLIFSQNEGKLIFFYSYRKGTHWVEYVEVVELPKIVQCYSFFNSHIFVCTEANELFSIQDFEFHYYNNNKPQFKKVPIPGDLGIVQICGNHIKNLFLLKNGAIAYLETNEKQINREDFIFFPEITFNCKQIVLNLGAFFLLSEQNELFKITVDRDNNNYCLSDIKVKLDNNDKIVKLFATGPCRFLVTEQALFARDNEVMANSPQ